MYRAPSSTVSTTTTPSAPSRRQSVNDEWRGAIPMDIDFLEEAKKERDLIIQKLEDAIFKKNQNRFTGGRQTINRLQTQLLARQQAITVMLNQQSTDLAYRRQIVPDTRGATKEVVYGN